MFWVRLLCCPGRFDAFAGMYLASFGHYILTFSAFRALRGSKVWSECDTWKSRVAGFKALHPSQKRRDPHALREFSSSRTPSNCNSKNQSLMLAVFLRNDIIHQCFRAGKRTRNFPTNQPYHSLTYINIPLVNLWTPVPTCSHKGGHFTQILDELRQSEGWDACAVPVHVLTPS